MKIVILYSSGLDSYIMKRLAEVEYPDAEIKCIYYAHGADSESQELILLPDYVDIRILDWLDENHRPKAKKSDPFAGEIYIPGRNLIFVSLAACQELPDQIWMGTLADEDNANATDKNEVFRNQTSDLLTYVLSPFVDGVEIKFPFVERGWSKRDSIKWALSNGVTASDLKETVSCWHYDCKEGKPCGRCKQCFKRKLNFNLFGIEEDMVKNPLDIEYGYPLIKGYVESFRSGKSDADMINVYNLIIENVGLGKIPKEWLNDTNQCELGPQYLS